MTEEQKLIHVYCMPGMAANPSIFEFIKLPEDQFKIHLLKWIIPEEEESLKKYAERMNKYIKDENAVLIGVSFGGVVVQEMAKSLNLMRLIIISSVKYRGELPRRIQIAGKSGLFRFIPTSLLDYVDHFEKIAVGNFVKNRAKLYRQYLSVRNQRYLTWAIKNMVLWDCEKAAEDIVHIHGDKDIIFPIKNIDNAITVKGGTHIMIIVRYRWFNKHLPEIILKGKITKKEKKIKKEI